MALAYELGLTSITCCSSLCLFFASCFIVDIKDRLLHEHNILCSHTFKSASYYITVWKPCMFTQLMLWQNIARCLEIAIPKLCFCASTYSDSLFSFWVLGLSLVLLSVHSFFSPSPSCLTLLFFISCSLRSEKR